MRKFRVVVNGNTYEVDIEEIDGGAPLPQASPSEPAVQPPRKTVAATAAPNPQPQAAANGTEGNVVAQMPGTIVEIKVKPGDRVSRGQALVILEAMKMANEVVAPADGTVASISVEKDASVNAGDILVVLN